MAAEEEGQWCWSEEDVGTAPEALDSFLAGRSVLVTGASGLVGMALLARLLSAFHALHTVFLLLRPKGGLDAQQRKDQLLSSQALRVALRRSPGSASKVVALEGDVEAAEALGLSAADAHRLRECVSCVFHCAASVRMRQALGPAARANLRGTEQLLRLAREMPHLRALVHVSSVFANHHLRAAPVLERVYAQEEPSPHLLLRLLRTRSDQQLQGIQHRLLDQRANTYVLTKALAEALVAEECARTGLRAAIVRPAIVVCAWREPEAGWLYGAPSGPTAVLAAMAQGQLQAALAEPDKIADLVPVDLVANCLLAAALRLHHRHASERAPLVLHVSSSCSPDPLTWRAFLKMAADNMSAWPSRDLLLPPAPAFHTWLAPYHLHRLLAQLLPAILLGRQALRAQQTLHRLCLALRPFSCSELRADTRRLDALWRWMRTEDRARFPFHPNLVRNWRKLMRTYVRGLRKHVLGQHPRTLPAARTRLMRMRIALWTAAIFLLAFVMAATQ